MPRVNSRGDLVAFGNGVCLLDDDTFIANRQTVPPSEAQPDGMWQVCTATSVEGPWTPVSDHGANELAAGGGVWCAWLAGYGLHDAKGRWPLFGLAGVGTDGRGSVASDGTIAIVPDRQHGYGLRLIRDGIANVNIPDIDARSVHVLSSLQAIWIDDGAVHVLGLRPPAAHPGEYFSAVRAIFVPAFAEYVLLLTNNDRLILRRWHSLLGRVVVPTPTAYHADAVCLGSAIRVVSSRRQGELAEDIETRDITIDSLTDDLTVPPPPPPPPAPLPPEPRSAPRPADGTVYDLAEYILGDPSLWPRSGPSHPMHQIRVPKGGGKELIYFVKFGDIAPDGRPHEVWAYDPRGFGFYFLQDASQKFPYDFDDPRWFPRHMQIGIAHAFACTHETIFRDRDKSCRVVRRESWSRRCWLHAVYDRYWWGPDLGERATIVIAYDPTGYDGNAQALRGRWVELGYFPLGGSARWESFHAELAYAGGPTPRLDDSTRDSHSDFYLLGGQAVQPSLTNCIAYEVPTYPPWDPRQKPEPAPSPYPSATPYEVPPMESEIVGLVGAAGKFARIDPAEEGQGSFDGYPVHFDRDAAGGHERFELTQPDEKFQLRAVDANVMLSADATSYSADLCTQFGTRPLDAWRGGYESWTIVRLPSGLVIAFIEYDHNGQRFTSAPVTVVKL